MDTTSIAACAAVGLSAALPADVESALTGWRAARAAQRQRTEDEICKKEREWAAACDALKNADVAPVGMPTHAVPRSRPRSKNEHGCCISSSDHIAELEAIEAEKKLVAMSSQQRVDEFWVNWRAPVREAEKRAPRAPVKHLGGLVVSRTGHVPKAANNKPPEMLILGEARAAITANAMTICPPTPSKEPDAAADATRKASPATP